MEQINGVSTLELMQARLKFIPKNWRLDKVGNVFNICNNFRKPISQEERSKIRGEHPYFGPTKIQDYISTYEQDGSYALIGEDGDHFLKYKSRPMTQLVDGKCTVNNHAHIVEGTEVATREWFYSYFMHRDIFSFLSRQGAGRYKLNKADLQRLPVLVPPLPEQKKIAQILTTWDKAIATTEQLLANSQQQKKALMQQLLTGKKRLLDENGDRFDGEWKEVLVKDIGDVITGSTPPKDNLNNYGNETSWATADDFKSKYVSDTNIKLSEEGVKKARLVPKGSVLVTCIASIGKNAIASEMLATNQQINAVVVDEGHSNEFFYYQIEFYKNKLLRLAGTTAVPIVNKRSFEKLKLNMPSQKEQDRISLILGIEDREVSALKKQVVLLKKEKKGLMQQLLTGKRRVRIEEVDA